VASRYTYTPYGKQTSPDPTLTDPNGDPLDRNPRRYAAGYYDTPTGMLKYGTRYYQPDLMRWTQPDPAAGEPNNPMTLNPYTYVGCNPINALDPTGRNGCGTAIGGAVVSGLGLGASTVGLFTTPLTGGVSGIAAVAGYELSWAGLILSLGGIQEGC
jgi:RHS repeat-associated protein